MKIIGKTVLCLLLTLLLALPLSACDGTKKAEQEYQAKVAELVEELSGKSEALNTAVSAFAASLSDENRTAVLDAVGALGKAFEGLSGIEAPEKYTETQSKLDKSVTSALEGVAVYQTEFTAVTAETFNEEFVERVERGDELVRQATSTILSATREFLPESKPDTSSASKADTSSEADSSEAA